MALQRSVQQQHEETLAEIRRVADLSAQGRFAPWLPAVLRSHDLSPEDGILVQLHEMPAQGGYLFQGLWLTQHERFWAFTVRVSRATGTVLEIEAFDDQTNETPADTHVRGIGKTFGRLALEILAQRSAQSFPTRQLARGEGDA
jgi:hypothetical protein